VNRIIPQWTFRPVDDDRGRGRGLPDQATVPRNGDFLKIVVHHSGDLGNGSADRITRNTTGSGGRYHTTVTRRPRLHHEPVTHTGGPAMPAVALLGCNEVGGMRRIQQPVQIVTMAV